MSKIFYNCTKLLFLPDISKWNTINVIDMSEIFYNCFSLLLLPEIHKWNTKNVINMDGLIDNCESLESPPYIVWKEIFDVLNFIIFHYIFTTLLPGLSLNDENIMNMNSKFEKSCITIKLIHITIFKNYFINYIYKLKFVISKIYFGEFQSLLHCFMK